MKWIKNIAEEQGASLVETLIAMAILMAVLVPAVTMFTLFANNRIVEEKIESFTIARNEMEVMISTRDNSSLTVQYANNWWIKRTVQQQEYLHHLKVEVFKNDTTRPPTITLETSRLWYHEK
ncbi:MAG: hypothetical protein MI700_07235 [Balneolales bacterium]|nr:hypothetical protein [Balneolales bacterium]